MKTMTNAPTARILAFNHPAPKLLLPVGADYYRECQLCGAAGVEINLRDGSVLIITATRYLHPDVTLAAVVNDETLDVLCFCPGHEPVLMWEETSWASYTVIRATA